MLVIPAPTALPRVSATATAKVDRFISASVSEDCSGGQRSATKLVTSCLAPLGPPPREGQSLPPTLSKAGQRDRHRTERPEASKLPCEHLAASPTSKVTLAGERYVSTR